MKLYRYKTPEEMEAGDNKYEIKVVTLREAVAWVNAAFAELREDPDEDVGHPRPQTPDA